MRGGVQSLGDIPYTLSGNRTWTGTQSFDASIVVNGLSGAGSTSQFKAVSGQTGNLIELYNNAGTRIAYFDQSGNFTSTGATSYASTQVAQSSATAVGFSVKGFAGATADLQQWQSSGGVVLFGITAGGALYGSSGLTVGGDLRVATNIRAGDTSTTAAYGLQILGGGGRIQAISSPAAAPTITVVGTAGTTTYTYYIIANDRFGNKTTASNGGSTTTGNATLSTTNYNTISWAGVVGAVSYDVLKTNGTTSLATNITATSINDTGQATAVYTVVVRNATGDLQVDGDFTVGTPSIPSTATITSSGNINTLTVVDTGTNGVSIKLVGNGGTTPNKFIRAISGQLQIVNSIYSAAIWSMDDFGNTTHYGGGSTARSTSASVLLTRGAMSTTATGLRMNSGGGGGTIDQAIMLIPNSEDLIVGLDTGGNFAETARFKSNNYFQTAGSTSLNIPQASGDYAAPAGGVNIYVNTASAGATGGRIAFTSNSPTGTDGAYIEYAPPSAGNVANQLHITGNGAVQLANLFLQSALTTIGSNAVNGTGIIIRGDNSTADPGLPWIRSNGIDFVINPHGAGQLYLGWDVANQVNVGTGGFYAHSWSRADNGFIMGAGAAGISAPNIHSDGASVYIETSGAGSIYLRPQGVGSTTNQVVLENNGNFHPLFVTMAGTNSFQLRGDGAAVANGIRASGGGLIISGGPLYINLDNQGQITHVYGPLNVESSSATNLTGTLAVTGTATFNGALNTGGAVLTVGSGGLAVNGAVQCNSTLNASGLLSIQGITTNSTVSFNGTGRTTWGTGPIADNSGNANFGGTNYHLLLVTIAGVNYGIPLYGW